MSLSTDNLGKLEHEYSLLRLFHHRNKNQHRVATWWKHLNTLKRDFTKLISLLNLQQRTPNERTQQRILKLGLHIRGVVVSKCHRAFHGIVALGQFLTLGLTLLGMLARLDSCVGKINGLDAFVLEKRRIQHVMSGSRGAGDVSVVLSGIADDLGEEIGEVIEDAQQVDTATVIKKRKSPDALPQGFESKKKKTTKEASSIKSSSKSGEQVKVKSSDEKKKKKKKKKSAIDDIFG